MIVTEYNSTGTENCSVEWAVENPCNFDVSLYVVVVLTAAVQAMFVTVPFSTFLNCALPDVTRNLRYRKGDWNSIYQINEFLHRAQ